MPKYLFEGRYSVEGAKGVAREGGSGRREAIKKMFEGLGGKMECLYFAFGDVDVYVIGDLPDNESAAAASLAINQSGAASGKVVVLVTPEEMDKAGKENSRLSARRPLKVWRPPARLPTRRRFMLGRCRDAPVAQRDRVSVFETGLSPWSKGRMLSPKARKPEPENPGQAWDAALVLRWKTRLKSAASPKPAGSPASIRVPGKSAWRKERSSADRLANGLPFPVGPGAGRERPKGHRSYSKAALRLRLLSRSAGRTGTGLRSRRPMMR
jgi:uncharacterized protein with GYD domain